MGSTVTVASQGLGELAVAAVREAASAMSDGVVGHVAVTWAAAGWLAGARWRRRSPAPGGEGDGRGRAR
ncbi:unnamed protein product [Urochloa humidicola]